MTTDILTPDAPGTARSADSFLYRFEADIRLEPIGIVPEGLRYTLTFEGEATEGDVRGARVWGTDHLLIRSDGVGVLDIQKTISLGDVHLYENVQGYCLPPAGMEPPPLEAILSPGFEWPDVLFPIHGFSTFRAGYPEWRHLNRAVARIDGWASFATGRLAVETHLLEHATEVEGPREPTAVD